MITRAPKYWVIVASKDHVKNGIAQGIAQVCHGKDAQLKKMQKGDFVIYYSGKQTLGRPDKCQEFTALGKVVDDEPYQCEVSEDFCPSRRDIEFSECKDTSILPLIADLVFIKNKKSWGYPFRFGFLEIDKQDFDVISSKMLQYQYA